MCGRYSLARESVEVTVGAEHVRRRAKPRYNIAPSQRAPVIRRNAQGLAIDELRWGLIPEWSRDDTIGFSLINARAETLAENRRSEAHSEVAAAWCWPTDSMNGNRWAAPSNPGDLSEAMATYCCSPGCGNIGNRRAWQHRWNRSRSSPHHPTRWWLRSTTGCPPA